MSKRSMDSIFQSMASGNHQRPPAHLPARFPLIFRRRLLFPQCTLYSRIQEWCIYGIIYHYAPFFLNNPMVTFSGPTYMIPNQVQNPSPISKEDLSAIQSGNFLAATRRPFEDPNHLALQELGCHFLSGLSKGAMLIGYQSFQSFSRHQVLSIPWTTKLVHTGSNQASCMALTQSVQFIFHCGNSVTQFNSQDGWNCIGPIQTIQPEEKYTTFIFTDGSSEEKGGLGAVATTANGKWQKKTPLGPEMSVSIAEYKIKEISLALDIIDENKNKITGADIFTFTDITGTLHLLKKPWAAETGQKLVLEIADRWNSISKHWNLNLHWFPGWQNIIGNELLVKFFRT
ncbi:hypothetical protein O181_071016 [Austropuccinia psidii MF-1]|uniref:RNase H type-1 domain-containing protein n=1 Tax=Austropuccinia psidii MF-1 TaxID=1389203 RepID=A0A9Q3EZX7_9BASI|nr:hypothetical protein [Austropuccinia psidii MF-1]